MPKNNDAGLLFRNGRSFRIFVTSLKIQNLDSNSTHFSDFVTEDQENPYRTQCSGACKNHSKGDRLDTKTIGQVSCVTSAKQ